MDQPPSIDVRDAGGEGALVRGEIDRERRHLLGPAEAPHGLAGDEGGARRLVVALRPHPVVQRRAVDGARADAVAADALRHEVGGDRLGQADHRRLGRAVGEAVRRGDDRGGDRGDVDDRARRRCASIPGRNARIIRYIAVTLRSNEKAQLLLVGIEDGAVLDEAGAVEQHVDVRRAGRAARRSRVAVAHVEAARSRAPAAASSGERRRRRCRWRRHARALRRHGERASPGRCPGPPP